MTRAAIQSDSAPSAERRETSGGQPMHKIRHIAIRAADQKKVVKFYMDTFGMK
jgi:Glyoxalase/Bleomycin resistance protein/Dioxygenase superfamily